MGRLREINTKAQFAFSPVSTLIATGTAAGSLSDDLSGVARIEIYDAQLDNNDIDAFNLKPIGSVPSDERCVSVVWGGVTAEKPHGVIAAAMESGAIDLWDPASILRNDDRDTALINRCSGHTGTVKCLDFSSVQTNLLASAGTKGEFFVWDTSSPMASPTSYKSSRLDDIISIAWNKKVGHIIALGGRSGALSVWDLRKKSELIHIPTRYGVSAIAWHPTEPTVLSSSSIDDHNPVIQIWDLRNANAPKASLTGHEKGVLSMSWCSQDADLLLSSGSDNRTLIWNPSKFSMIAELPASSQWVHKVSWCVKQPQIVANATLDGKISLYSLQDTITPAVPAVVDSTPAGDDFFDSIPKNFQAQTTTFTLKQTPKWLRRPVGSRFAFGSQLVQFNSKSTTIEIVKHQFSTTATSMAEDIQKELKNQTLSELCEASRQNAKDGEKQDWHIIETLASEHARAALLEYLGFNKEEPNKDNTTTIAPKSDKAAQDGTEKSANDVKLNEVEEPSVFGTETADDDFLGIINSGTPLISTDAIEANEAMPDSSKSKPFSIFTTSATAADNLVTKAILTGQFDRAIDVCLQEDRLSDAFMLALCGGSDSQKKVQKAYFERTTIPYGRLLSSIIAGDLPDVVNNAKLKDWKETLAILCNYAKPEDFPTLCELLGRRLENEAQNQADAILCYLAGSKLEHLVRLWSEVQYEDERAALSSNEMSSPSETHATALGLLIKKIAIFKKAVTFVDANTKDGPRHILGPLYQKYLEFARLISDEGNTTAALQYVEMVPSDFDGAAALKARLSGPEKPAKVVQSQKSGSARPTGLRNAYSQVQPIREQGQSSASPLTTNSYRPPVGATNNVPSNASNGSQPTSQSLARNPYAPPSNEAQAQSQSSQYGSAQSPYQAPYGNGNHSLSSQQQTQYNAFAPPPRVLSSGPAILPAAQRKDITPWNDAPDMPQPAQRRATPAVNRSAITSPFQNAPGPALQGFGPAPTPQLAPPPKSRSPALPKPVAPSTTQSTQETQRRPSNPYAPAPMNGSPLGYGAQATGATGSAYAPIGGQGRSASSYGPVPVQQQYQPQQAAQQPTQVLSGSQSSIAPVMQSSLFAAPPKQINGPPRASASRAGTSPKISAPPVARAVNLSPEPSRQNSPVLERPELPVARYPAGDRAHIPESDRPIEHELFALLHKLQTVSPEKYRRPLEDTGRRLNSLLDQLNNSQLTDGTREQLRILAASLRVAEWGRAYAIHMELTSDKMHECRDWIVGIKTLIVLGKKSAEESWS